MAEKPTSKTEQVLVACDVCLTEIPASVAVSQEADEYAQHFCGLECYNKWKTQELAKTDRATNNKK